MKLHIFLLRLLSCAILILMVKPVLADQINVAVASNFIDAAKEISRLFEKESAHQVILVLGATGKHFAQIKNGAPFDVFLAADTKRPLLLETQGYTQQNSRFTYAIGKLVLWSMDANLIDSEGEIMQTETLPNLAMANPQFAPYGKAAQEVLIHFGLWDAFKTKAVRGENVGQAFHFVRSENVKLGFVALSQLKRFPEKYGSHWLIPQSLYSPIEQQGVLLSEKKTARLFFTFLRNPKSLKIIRKWGYETP